MNKPVLNISEEANQQLDRLVHGFKKLNGFHKVELYRVTDGEVVIGAKKFIDAETDEEDIKQYKKIFIKALRDIYKPFTGERKVYVHMKFYIE